MAFDGLVMAAVAQELQDKLIGGRIEKIHQPGPNELVLVIHTRELGKQRLLISADSRDARIHLSQIAYVNPMAPPIFCMVLRKHLEGSRIRSIRQVELERVLELSIDSRDELGRPSEKLLFCEVMGKHSNIILVNPDSKTILDGVNRYSHSVSRYREVLPNRPYLPPPEQGKLDPRTISEEQFRSIMIKNEELSSPVMSALLRILDGVGPQTCRELVARAGLSPDYALEFCGDYELRQLWQQVNWLGDLLEQGAFQPTLLLDRRGYPLEFSAIDLSHLQSYSRQSGSISEILDRYYQSLGQRRTLESTRQSLLQVVRREIDRLQKKIAIYQKSLATAEKGDIYRIYGELITANLYQLEQGPEARVENFYEPATEIVIPMESARTPSENAQSYFKKYLKAKNTREAVLEQFEQAQSELTYFEAVENALTQALETGDLDEIRGELEEQAYLKPKTLDRKKTKKEQHTPQPLSFVSTDGFTILVGKNNKQNDYLTLKMAKEADIWLHTKDIPGSHVIISCGLKNEVPDQTLLEAASLAAWFSKARQSGKVPVDYTLRRNVRKPRGAKPGMVIYDNQRTLSVTPSEELVDKLTSGD